MNAEFAARSVATLRMVGFALALAWVGLLIASFVQIGLRTFVNGTGLYVFAFMVASLFILRPLERLLRERTKS